MLIGATLCRQVGSAILSNIFRHASLETTSATLRSPCSADCSLPCTLPSDLAASISCLSLRRSSRQPLTTSALEGTRSSPRTPSGSLRSPCSTEPVPGEISALSTCRQGVGGGLVVDGELGCETGVRRSQSLRIPRSTGGFAQAWRRCKQPAWSAALQMEQGYLSGQPPALAPVGPLWFQ